MYLNLIYSNEIFSFIPRRFSTITKKVIIHSSPSHKDFLSLTPEKLQNFHIKNYLHHPTRQASNINEPFLLFLIAVWPQKVRSIIAVTAVDAERINSRISNDSAGSGNNLAIQL